MFEKEERDVTLRALRERRPGGQSESDQGGDQSQDTHLGDNVGTVADVAASLHDRVGNEIVSGAVQQGPDSGFDATVAGDLGSALAGLGGGSSFESNQAMCRAMRRSQDETAPEMPKLNLSGGKPLDAATQARFEAAMDHDFSHVRVHTDGTAQSKAKEVSAHAFAVGPHIFFSSGEFAPGTPEGDKLLAHELTHVVQHDESRLGQLPGDREVSLPTDRTEVEAYANEKRVGTALNQVDAAIANQEVAAPEATLPGQGILDLVEQGTEEGLPDAVSERMQSALGVGASPATPEALSGASSSSAGPALHRSPDADAANQDTPAEDGSNNLFLESHELEDLREEFVSDALQVLHGLRDLRGEIYELFTEQITMMVSDALDAVVSAVEGEIEGDEAQQSTEELIRIEYMDFVAPVITTLPEIYWEEDAKAASLREGLLDHQIAPLEEHIAMMAFDRYTSDVTRSYHAYAGVLTNPDIALQSTHTSGNMDNADPLKEVMDTAQGEQAERSAYQTAPGGAVTLSRILLSALIELTQEPYNYTIRITELAGGAHSTTSRHYAGIAVDVDTINGTQVSASHPDLTSFMSACRTLGATEVLGPGFPNHDHHVHAAWPRDQAE